jgi:stage III sporulation protein AE
MVILIVIMGIFLETIHSTFERQLVKSISNMVIQWIGLILVIDTFRETIQYAKTAIEGMVQFMQAMIPIYMTLMASMGNVVSVTVMHPIMVVFIQLIGHLVAYVIFPLFFFSTILHLVSSISERYQVTNLANLLRKIGITLLGVTVSVFIGITAAQGATSAAADGIAIKTAKYIVGNFVPVVGRVFSDATDTALGASLIIKNTIGLTGLIILILYCLFPALKVAAIAFMYLLISALLQPLGPHPMVQNLQMIGKNLIYVFASMVAVGFMFFFALTVLIAVGNWSYMFR